MSEADLTAQHNGFRLQLHLLGHTRSSSDLTVIFEQSVLRFSDLSRPDFFKECKKKAPVLLPCGRTAGESYLWCDSLHGLA